MNSGLPFLCLGSLTGKEKSATGRARRYVHLRLSSVKDQSGHGRFDDVAHDRIVRSALKHLYEASFGAIQKELQ
jgi:hypothetical protein